MIFDHSNLIPRNCQGNNQQAEALVPAQDSCSMAVDILKIICFDLSNGFSRQHDESVLQLFEVLSRTNLPVLSGLLLERCKTSNAIKEAIYKCAIRKKNYTIIMHLLKSGVNPEVRVGRVFEDALMRNLGRGAIGIRFSCFKTTFRGIEIAAITADTRLGKILLDAGANPNTPDHGDLPPLGVIGFDPVNEVNLDDALEFAHMLVKHGAEVNPSESCWDGALIYSPLELAIARHDDLLAGFLIEQGANKVLYRYEECAYEEEGGWLSWELKPFGYRNSPLLVAIVSNSNDLTERLLQPILLQPSQVHPQFIKEILIASCLAGDAAVVSGLLGLDIDLDNGWEGWMTPLVATVWNTDTTIAEMLLMAGANVGPTRSSSGWDSTTRVSVPIPIHGAAFRGNAKLVQILIDRGASCNVLGDWPQQRGNPNKIRLNRAIPWLTPWGLSSSLRFALASGDIGTVNLLLPHSEIVGGELIQAISLGNQTLISELISRGADILFARKDGATALEPAAEKGNMEVISLFFASGGKYRSSALYESTKLAIESGDCSVMTNLMDHRPAGAIDSHEASCLVLALQESQWSLVIQMLGSFSPGPSQSFYSPKWGDGFGRHCIHEFHEYPDHSGVGITPLWAAYLSGNVPIIKEMLHRGFSLHKSDHKSFGVTAMGYHDERSKSIQALLLSVSQFESMNQAGRQLLLYCAMKSYDFQKTRVREYIKLFDSLNFTIPAYRESASPLQLAINMNHRELVSELIDAGADIEYVGDAELLCLPEYYWELKSPLQQAVSKGYVEVVKLLISRGADINKPPFSSRGFTALQSAAIQGNLVLARILVDHGADINALPAKASGRTALEGAAECGRLDILQYLLEMGAKLGDEMRIYYVRSVWFARSNGYYVIADHLREYGSWTEEDQILYDRPSTLETDGYFSFDEQSKDWHLRRVTSIRDMYLPDAGLVGEMGDRFALMFWPWNSFVTGQNYPQRLSDEGERYTMSSFVELFLGLKLDDKQDNVESEPTAGKQQWRVAGEQESDLQVRPALEQVLTTDTGFIPWSDPFFGADEVEDVWNI
ncbi:hypothetical protein NUW58_g1369 [Xylaria curta]|uniref:Uncharacterized protein n=1 Tax=Xylaria curta TaxID=42375 RepID=A0ACC1PNG2_9PEZI|nr:hypothetical protein NUW58_g1369 [Xylaria curta]